MLQVFFQKVEPKAKSSDITFYMTLQATANVNTVYINTVDIQLKKLWPICFSNSCSLFPKEILGKLHLSRVFADMSA